MSTRSSLCFPVLNFTDTYVTKWRPPLSSKTLSRETATPQLTVLGLFGLKNPGPLLQNLVCWPILDGKLTGETNYKVVVQFHSTSKDLSECQRRTDDTGSRSGCETELPCPPYIHRSISCLHLQKRVDQVNRNPLPKKQRKSSILSLQTHYFMLFCLSGGPPDSSTL